MAKAPIPKRGEIWLIDFDPAIGAEIRKIRPALVISLDTIGRLPLRMVVPVTDWKPAYSHLPWFVLLPATSGNGLAKDSGADAFQTKSV
jgi:mRNA interferase MazF